MTRIWIIIGICLVIGISADVYFGDSRPGFTASLGFFGCGLIVFGSKWLGAWLLQRPEAYYLEAELDQADADQLGERDDA